MTILDRQFYEHDTIIVARELLGKILLHKLNGRILSGVIVETEAYRESDDPASHAFKGKTKRNAPMFGAVGHSYVYFIYGNHFCFNIVAKSKRQKAGAVLIRALEPVKGIDIMQQHRNQTDIRFLANGPGKLTQAFGISKKHNDLDLTNGERLCVMIPSAGKEYTRVITTGRIGINVAKNYPWRFCIANNQYISK